jgi:hypothetical protein
MLVKYQLSFHGNLEEDWHSKLNEVTAHTVNTTALLQEFFGVCFVWHDLWLPSSADLIPSDFSV